MKPIREELIQKPPKIITKKTSYHNGSIKSKRKLKLSEKTYDSIQLSLQSSKVQSETVLGGQSTNSVKNIVDAKPEFDDQVNINMTNTFSIPSIPNGTKYLLRYYLAFDEFMTL